MHEITMRKSKRTGWEAKTRLDFEGNQKMTVTTSKDTGGVSTYASVSLHRDGFTTHAICGDYSKRILHAPNRATEKTIRQQHERALENIAAVLSDAREHYAKGAKGAQYFENLKAASA